MNTRIPLGYINEYSKIAADCLSLAAIFFLHMKTSKQRFYLILLLFVGLICAKCDKDNCKGYYSYSFETNGLAIHPAADSIRLGDTMWVVYDEPVNPIDLLTGDSIDLSGGTNFISFISFLKFKDDRRHELALAKFTIGSKMGTLLAHPTFPNKAIQFIPKSDSHRLKVLLCIIPMERGDYSLASNDVNPLKLNTAPKDFCGGASFKIPFSNDDNHLWIYRQYLDSNFIFGAYEKEHVYCFRVY